MLLGVTTLGCAKAPRARFPHAESALSQLEEQTSCSRAVQGEADLVVSGSLAKLRGKMMYLAQTPAKIRFDLYSEFGVTLSTVTSDGSKFSYYSLDQKSFWYGPARTCNLERFTRVRVPPFALVELLRGRPPVLAHDRSAARLRFARPLFSRGRYVIDIEGQRATTERIEIGVLRQDYDKPLSAQRLRLMSVRVEQAGQMLYEVELSDYQESRRLEPTVTPEEAEMGVTALPPSGPPCRAELPGALEFSVPNKGYKLVIENKVVHHNPAISPQVFSQPVPRGVRVERSDCND